MNARINDKITDIERLLIELEQVIPESIEQYLADFKSKAASERYAEKIIEAIIDIARLTVKEKHLGIPENDKQVFSMLANARVITGSLALRLQDAKGMRNILAHDYGEVDDEIVFTALSQQLEDDTEQFLAAIRKAMK